MRKKGIVSTIIMEYPNQEILIYQGEFHFGTHLFNGKIFVKWVPRHQLRFEILDCSDLKAIFDKNEISITIGSQNKKVKFFIENKFYGETINIKGSINEKLIFTQSKKKIKYIDFNLVNFREYFGLSYQKSPKGSRLGHISFISTDHSIEIQNILDEKSKKAIKSEGGYIISNNCRIKFNKVTPLNRVNFIVKRLKIFLSFLNGRRVAPLFLKAYSSDEKIIWEDYSPYITDHHKYVQSWLPFRFDDEFCSLWNKFLNVTETESDFEKMDFVIHWYLEALNNSGYTNGSIIFLQNSFETLYSWLVLEKGEIKAFGESDKEKNYASNKIRSLLFHFSLSTEFPKEYRKTFKEFDLNKSEDFAYVFPLIRNAYVHYSESKKKDLEKLKGKTWPLLNTGIFYLEVLLLRIIGYKGIIRSRIKGSAYPAENQVSIFNLSKELAVK